MLVAGLRRDLISFEKLYGRKWIHQDPMHLLGYKPIQVMLIMTAQFRSMQ
jgi:hypothetical protein